jgi:hypothetical protein
MIKDAQKSEFKNGEAAIAVWRLLLIFIAPLAGILGTYYSLREDIKVAGWERTNIKERVDNHERRIDILRDAIDTHRNLGPGGLPHTEATPVKLSEINDRLKALESRK